MSSQGMRAGALYFALVFATGFGLGGVRTIFLAPAVGELAAVAVEVPIILTVAWGACLLTVRSMRLSPAMADRATMGGTALGLLLVADAIVSVTLIGNTLAEHLGSYQEPAQLLGLAAQLMFASFPLVVRARQSGVSRGRVPLD
jgi:hypothetical protein